MTDCCRLAVSSYQTTINVLLSNEAAIEKAGIEPIGILRTPDLIYEVSIQLGPTITFVSQEEHTF